MMKIIALGCLCILMCNPPRCFAVNKNLHRAATPIIKLILIQMKKFVVVVASCLDPKLIIKFSRTHSLALCVVNVLVETPHTHSSLWHGDSMEIIVVVCS
jgi:hypothetical protein